MYIYKEVLSLISVPLPPKLYSCYCLNIGLNMKMNIIELAAFVSCLGLALATPISYAPLLDVREKPQCPPGE
jgi:hypothetical protein